MRKLAMLGASALVLVFGVVQASATPTYRHHIRRHTPSAIVSPLPQATEGRGAYEYPGASGFVARYPGPAYHAPAEDQWWLPGANANGS